MNVQFESQLQDVIAGLAPQFRQDQERKVAALRAAGGTSYDGLLAVTQDTGQPLDVRLTAIWVLGCLRDTSAAPALLATLADAHPDIRRYAAIALGDLRDRRAVSPLIRALQTDADARVRKGAAKASLSISTASTGRPLRADASRMRS